MLFNINLTAELFGLIATALMFFGFSKTDDKNLIILHTLSNAFWALHFLILGSFAGFVSILFSLSRTFFVFKWTSNKSKWIFLTVLFIYCIYEISLIQNFHNLLPIVATLVVSYGILFYYKHKLTLVFIISNILWVFYSIIENSMSGTICYTIVIMILIFRFLKIQKEKIEIT